MSRCALHEICRTIRRRQQELNGPFFSPRCSTTWPFFVIGSGSSAAASVASAVCPWRAGRIIDRWELNLGVPVVHPMPARCWEIQLRLSISQRVRGYGRLLAEMIPGYRAASVEPALQVLVNHRA
jgi:hypothetical protein